MRLPQRAQQGQRREALPEQQRREQSRHHGGTVGRVDGVEQAARAIAVDLMGTLHAAMGDLNKVTRIVKLMSLVNSTGTFTEQHLVTNGASELFGQVFGERPDGRIVEHRSRADRQRRRA